MGTKIGVISPKRRQGETAMSILLTVSCSIGKLGKVVFVPMSDSFQDITEYTSIEPSKDYTSSVTNLYNNVTEIQSVDAASDYMQDMGPATILFSSNERDRMEYNRKIPRVVKYLPHEIVIVDISADLNERVTKDIMKECDFIFVVMNMENAVAENYKTWKEEFDKDTQNKFYFLINRYDPDIAPLKEFSKLIGVHVGRCRPVSYNPFLIKLANAGALQTFGEYIEDDDSRFMDLSSDFQSIVNLIGTNACIKTDWPEV